MGASGINSIVSAAAMMLFGTILIGALTALVAFGVVCDLWVDAP